MGTYLYEIVIDRESEFFNMNMNHIIKILVTLRQIKIVAYNPRSDGVVERQMRTLKDQLVALIRNNVIGMIT